MNIEEAKKIAKDITTDDLLNYWEGPEEPYEAIQGILNELDKKDAVINMMANYIRASDIDEDICKTETECISENLQCENCIKEYFYKKAEEEENENHIPYID